jgi:hypothetical protein
MLQPCGGWKSVCCCHEIPGKALLRSTANKSDRSSNACGKIDPRKCCAPACAAKKKRDVALRARPRGEWIKAHAVPNTQRAACFSCNSKRVTGFLRADYIPSKHLDAHFFAAGCIYTCKHFKCTKKSLCLTYLWESRIFWQDGTI